VEKWSVEIQGSFYFQDCYGDWDATGEDETYVFSDISKVEARNKAVEKYLKKYDGPDIEVVLDQVIVQEV
jgi:hypothetical protein